MPDNKPTTEEVREERAQSAFANGLQGLIIGVPFVLLIALIYSGAGDRFVESQQCRDQVAKLAATAEGKKALDESLNKLGVYGPCDQLKYMEARLH